MAAFALGEIESALAADALLEVLGASTETPGQGSRGRSSRQDRGRHAKGTGSADAIS